MVDSAWNAEETSDINIVSSQHCYFYDHCRVFFCICDNSVTQGKCTGFLYITYLSHFLHNNKFPVIFDPTTEQI